MTRLENIAPLAPFSPLEVPLGLDGGDGVIGAGCLEGEFGLESFVGVFESAVLLDKVVDVSLLGDFHGIVRGGAWSNS